MRWIIGPTTFALTTLLTANVSAQMFTDVTDSVLPNAIDGWTNKVDLADVDGDGDVDILFANGQAYSTPGPAETNTIFLNDGEGNFSLMENIFTAGSSRVVKARDINGDGNADIIVGNNYQTQSQLFLGDGAGGFTDVTESHFPDVVASVGDFEVGDVDGDGDLDLLLVNWGPGDALRNEGGVTLLWLNDGTGKFKDVTTDQMPDKPIGMSWDLEFVDVDNDFDLDIMVSCKACTGSSLFHNDGAGNFTDASDQLPQFGNNYEFEPLDFDGDGNLDVVTINDGPAVDGGLDLQERIFLGDGVGGFRDATSDLWPDEANIGEDDNMILAFDIDSDGDADFIIASLDGPDRLLTNDGEGNLTLDNDIFGGPDTPGTLGMKTADLNGDGIWDIVQSQGELADPEKVYFGTVPVDTAAPIIMSAIELDNTIVARVHDNKAPLVEFDFQKVVIKSDAGETPMAWYGEYLWRATPQAEGSYTVCATDRQGNESCSAPIEITATGTKSDEPTPMSEVDESGSDCSSVAGSPSILALMLIGLFGIRRRRK